MDKQQAMKQARQTAIDNHTLIAVVETFNDNTGEQEYEYAPPYAVFSLFPPGCEVIGEYSSDGTFLEAE